MLIRHCHGYRGFDTFRAEFDAILRKNKIDETDKSFDVLVYRGGPEDDYIVMLGVITPTGSVILEEPWNVFPSDELLTKLRMIA
jgi:hypothetical protein